MNVSNAKCKYSCSQVELKHITNFTETVDISPFTAMQDIFSYGNVNAVTHGFMHSSG